LIIFRYTKKNSDTHERVVETRNIKTVQCRIRIESWRTKAFECPTGYCVDDNCSQVHHVESRM